MPAYSYTARTKTGEKVKGVVNAKDKRAALAEIEKKGLLPSSVCEGQESSANEKTSRGGREGKMSSRELLIFTTELSDLLASGMMLGQALTTLSNRKSGRPSDIIIAELRDAIIQGSSLSDALARHPKTFSNLYVSMIKAGEASGAMSEVLKRLLAHYERLQEVKEKVIMAMVYPMIVIVLGVLTLIFSMVFVVPKFTMIFEQMQQALPLPTRILIGSSRWLARYGIFALASLGIIGVLLKRFTATEKGRFLWHGTLLRLPLIRGIVASAIFANFARTLSTLLDNGVPVLQALEIVERTVGNSVIAKEIKNARERVTDGTTISGPLAAGKVFPPIMTDMLAVGEQTGDTVGALNHIARRYENELDRNVKIFTTALEPILIVVVALMVGFVAVSILMAVFNMTSGLNV